MTAGTPATAGIEEWTLVLDGDVESPVTLDWAAFNSLPQQDFTADIHCVTRWSKLDTRWRGVSLQVLADLVRPKTGSDYVQARADGNYTANLRLRDLVVPDLYFWKSAKWLRGLHFSPFDYKGYWEKLGYHNYGDPWLEQRYRG
jgi:DMSO/TMAO reductase YedYZ molybdopterin-dependent catalytic subunit